MTITRDIGSTIDELYMLRQTRLAREKDIDKLKAEEKALVKIIMEEMGTISLTAARGTLATAAIYSKTRAVVDEWEKVYEYIKANDMFELLHKRLTTTLWEALAEDGVVVPGTHGEEYNELSLTKAGSKT